MGGTVLADGNEDCTVSATTGYFYYETQQDRKYWRSMRWMIDTAFYPFDGEKHCWQAYKSDPDEEFEVRFKKLLWILTFFVCLIISLISYTYLLVSKLF